MAGFHVMSLQLNIILAVNTGCCVLTYMEDILMVVACSNCTLNLVHLSLESVATSKTLLGTIFGHLWIFQV